MAKLKIQNRAILLTWCGLSGLWFFFTLIAASESAEETILDTSGIFLIMFSIPVIFFFIVLKIIDWILSVVPERPKAVKNSEDFEPSEAAKPAERNWEVHRHGSTFYITFKKQPILLNMILGGLFGGIFTGTFAFAFTESIVVVAVIVTCAVCLGAILGRRTAKHMNAKPDQYKPLLEKTKWGYIQRDALSARIWSKKPK